MTDRSTVHDRVVAVIGGGISGLAAARVLAGLAPVSEQLSNGGDNSVARRTRVVVLEAGHRLGGKVASGELAGQPVELGPDQFLRRDPSAERLCRHLGLGDDLVAPAASTAAVWSRGKMRGLPRGLVLGVPTDLDAVEQGGIVSAEGVNRARLDGELDGPVLDAFDVGLGEPPADGPVEERSAGEILRARLGDETVDRLVDPLLGGINAGGVDTMSLGTAAPQIAQALIGHRDVIAPLAATLPAASGSAAPSSPFYGLRGGLSRLIDACCEELAGAGVEIRTSSPVNTIRSSGTGWLLETGQAALAVDGIVLAVPGYAGSELTKDCVPDLAGTLGEIAYASVAVVTLAFRTEALSLPSRWTGVLVPRIEGRLMTAATWLSVKWPWMSGEETSYVRVSAGRFGDARIDDLGDEELAARLTSELSEIAGIDAGPFACKVTRYERSFPQYQPGHRSRVAAMAKALYAKPGLALAGAVLGGIGIPACITSGEVAANRLTCDLGR